MTGSPKVTPEQIKDAADVMIRLNVREGFDYDDAWTPSDLYVRAERIGREAL